MRPTQPASRQAAAVRELACALQRRLVTVLERLAASVAGPAELELVEWLRDGGRHGGGQRFVAAETPVFNRVSVNVSSVHYDDEPARKLGSATALSTIIHPAHPRGPSLHMHVSWTEMRGGRGYWRLMADLNPSLDSPDAAAAFRAALESVVSPRLFERGREQGDRYFFIPALQRHRGAVHFYLESHSTGDFEADRELARRFGETVTDTYAGILRAALSGAGEPTRAEREAQLRYHSVYFLQVLTLDRGTTSGLLVHDQNDVGILGSLPAFVDRELLASWVESMPEPQDQLLASLVRALPGDDGPAHVSDAVRAELANVVREHYRAHPEALRLQASGNVIPPTVANHSGGE